MCGGPLLFRGMVPNYCCNRQSHKNLEPEMGLHHTAIIFENFPMMVHNKAAILGRSFGELEYITVRRPVDTLFFCLKPYFFKIKHCFWLCSVMFVKISSSGVSVIETT